MKSAFRTTIAALALVNPAIVLAASSAPVNTGSLSLSAGNYSDSAGTHCGEQITTVDANTFVMSEIMDNCTDSGVTSQTFRRTSGIEFVAVWNGQDVDATLIAECTPTSSNATPCDSFLYDSTGKLIIQEGDVVDQVSSVVALSATSFTSGNTGVQIERNGNVVSSIPISDTPLSPDRTTYDLDSN